MKKVIYLFLTTFVVTLSGCNDEEWVNTLSSVRTYVLYAFKSIE